MVSSPPLHDARGNVIIPKALVQQHDPRLTSPKLWLKFAEMLPLGQDTLTFTDMDELCNQLGYANRRSFYRVFRKLEALGWIKRTRSKNSVDKEVKVIVLTQPAKNVQLPTRGKN